MRALFHHRFTGIELFSGATIVVFFFSQYATGLPAVGGLIQAMENVRVKYVLAFMLVAATLVIVSKRKRFLYLREAGLLLGNVLILVVVSVIYQILNGFNGDTFNEAMYFVVPVALVWALVNYENGNIKKYIDFCYIVCWLCFFTQMFDDAIALKLSIGPMAIDFVNSYSPFESGLAFFSVVFVFFYSYTGDKKKSILAFILCVLTLKRMSLFFAFLFILTGSHLAAFRVNRLMATLVFCLVPLLFLTLCNDSVSSFFLSATGLDLNQFMKGRFDFANVLADNRDQIRYGLGSCRDYLSSYYQVYYNTVGIVEYYDPHNDVFRFFLECTILGSLSLAGSHFYITSGKTCSTLLMFYIFVECCFNHLFGAGNTMYWLIVYMVIYYIDHQLPSNSLPVNRQKLDPIEDCKIIRRG